MVAHNGEINTLRGNVNWMAARQASVDSRRCSATTSRKLWPISYEGQSDTACFDNALEFLVRGGYSLAHAVMMLIPEAWAGNPLMDEDRRAFYEYHAALMEPWDGPAAIAFTDGRADRRDARPQRPAAGALSRHRRRPRRAWPRRWACCRSRRRRSSTSGVCSPARCCSSTSSRAASSPTTRSSTSSPTAHPYKEWLERTQIVLEDLQPVAGARVAHRRVAARSPAGLRLHAGGPEAPAWRRWPSPARRRSARWAPTRRSRRSPTSRSCSTPISSRTSRR